MRAVSATQIADILHFNDKGRLLPSFSTLSEVRQAVSFVRKVKLDLYEIICLYAAGATRWIALFLSIFTNLRDGEIQF